MIEFFSDLSPRMDLFGVGIRFGTQRLYETLGDITRYFQRPGLALNELHLAMLVRLLSLRHVAIYVVPNDSALYRDNCERLPDWLQFAVRAVPTDDRLLLAPAEVLCILFSHELGFSALFVDTVARSAHEFRLCATEQTNARCASICRSLRRHGLLADVAERPFHELDCDMGRTPMHALACCGLLNNALSNGLRDLDDAIYNAMVEACSDEHADAVHSDLSHRLDKAFLALWNAAEENGTESVAQAQLLGPMCNRAALRSLCTLGQPSSELLFEALKHVGPTDTEIALHSIACGSARVPDAALGILREARMAVICLRADLSPDSVLRHTVLLVRRAAGTKPFLFVAANAAPDVNASLTLNALAQLTGAERHDLPVGGVSPAYTSVVLPLMMFRWWSLFDMLLDEDSFADKVLEEARRCVIDTVSESPAHTWFYRVLLSLALDSAHRNLMAVKIPGPDDEIDSFTEILLALHVGPQSILASQALRRRRAERMRTLMAEVATVVDRAREFAALYPPPLWSSTADTTMLRRYYYYIARRHLSSERMITLLVAAVRKAREVCEELDNAQQLAALLCPLIDKLMIEWPFMLFNYSDDGDQVPEAIRLESHNYGVVLQGLIAQRADAPIPLVLCPVLVIAPDQQGTVLSILQFDSLRRRGQITSSGVLMCRLDQYVRATVSQLGAMQRPGDEPPTRQEYEDMPLDPSDLKLPLFSKKRAPTLMELPNSRSIAAVHFKDDDDAEFSCQISIRPSHDDAGVVAAGVQLGDDVDDSQLSSMPLESAHWTARAD